MNQEIFHLYGMRITVLGDTSKARDLAFQARRLNLRRDNAGVPQLRLNYPDGSFVHVLRQADMDFATIYVPPVISQAKAVRERIEIKYIPVFEAYDQNDIFIGYVLCLGDGFNGPYEFIPKPSLEELAPFDWGRWLGWYSDRPFDDLYEYLKHKLVFRSENRELWEIPPHGTNNSIFESLSASSYNENNNIGGNPQCNECCYDGILGEHIYQYSLQDTFSIDTSGAWEKVFTLSESVSYGYDPETIYGEGSSGYEVLDNIIGIQESTYTETGNTFGIFRYSAGVTSVGSEQTCDDAKAATPESYQCTALESAYASDNITPASWTSLYDPIRDCRYGVIFSGAIYNAAITSYEIDQSQKYENERHTDPKYSSAYDEYHYGIVFLNRSRMTVGNNYVEWDYCPLSTECIPETVSSETISGSKVSAVLSGIEYEIGDYSDDELNEIYESDCWSDFPIRYYQDGSLEFLLGGVLIQGETVNSKYFYIMQNSGKNVQFDDTAELSSDSRYYADLEDIKYNNQPIRMHHEFRLFKEIKTIKEEING